MSTDSVGKKISDLRVCDLKTELEKRGLETTGIKVTLAERLNKVNIISKLLIFFLLHLLRLMHMLAYTRREKRNLTTELLFCCVYMCYRTVSFKHAIFFLY